MAGIESLRVRKTWSESNYDAFSKVKNRDKDAYRKFKTPCFFQKIKEVAKDEELEQGNG